MRALRTSHHHPPLRPGVMGDKSTGGSRRARREGHGLSVFANPAANDRLDSWKEIASHLKRTVRTVQRWERHEGLPVHRHLHQRAHSVYACKSEVDEWWNHEPHPRGMEPRQMPSEGSRRQVTSPQVFAVIQSEEECRESYLALSQWLVEYSQELREAEICSPEDRTGHVVCFRSMNSYWRVFDSTGSKKHDKKRQSHVSFYVACLALKWPVPLTQDSGSNPQNADRFILRSIGGLWRLSLI